MEFNLLPSPAISLSSLTCKPKLAELLTFENTLLVFVALSTVLSDRLGLPYCHAHPGQSLVVFWAKVYGNLGISP